MISIPKLKGSSDLTSISDNNKDILIIEDNKLKASLLKSIFSETAEVIKSNSNPTSQSLDENGNEIPVGSLWITDSKVWIKLNSGWTDLTTSDTYYFISENAGTMYVGTTSYSTDLIKLNDTSSSGIDTSKSAYVAISSR